MSLRRNIILLLVYATGLGWSAYELQKGAPIFTQQDDVSDFSGYHPPAPITFTSSIDRFDAIVQRPLFSPDRRPVPPEEGPKTGDSRNSSINISGLRASAIFETPGTITALIEQTRGEPKIVQKGDLVGSWEVLEILDDQLILGRGGERQTLHVYDFTKPPPIAKRFSVANHLGARIRANETSQTNDNAQPRSRGPVNTLRQQ